MKIDESFIIIPLVICVACLFLYFLSFFYKLWCLQVEKWANEQEIKIVKCKVIWFFHPFPKFTTSRSQVIYKALVLDRDGNKRIAWLRVGGYWLGCFVQKVECIWSDATLNKY